MSYTQQEQCSVCQTAIWIDHREATLDHYNDEIIKTGDTHGYAN
jgi:hypothetical protein